MSCAVIPFFIMLLAILPGMIWLIKVDDQANFSVKRRYLIGVLGLLTGSPAFLWLYAGSLIGAGGGTLPTDLMVQLIVGLIVSIAAVCGVLLIYLTLKSRLLWMGVVHCLIIAVVQSPLVYFAYTMMDQHKGYIEARLVSPDGKREAHYTVEPFFFTANGWVQIVENDRAFFQERLSANAPTVEQRNWSMDMYWTADSQGVVIIKYSRNPDADEVRQGDITVWFYDVTDPTPEYANHAEIIDLLNAIPGHHTFQTPESVLNELAKTPVEDLTLENNQQGYYLSEDDPEANADYVLTFMTRHGALTGPSVSFYAHEMQTGVKLNRPTLQEIIDHASPR